MVPVITPTAGSYARFGVPVAFYGLISTLFYTVLIPSHSLTIAMARSTAMFYNYHVVWRSMISARCDDNETGCMTYLLRYLIVMHLVRSRALDITYSRVSLNNNVFW